MANWTSRPHQCWSLVNATTTKKCMARPAHGNSTCRVQPGRDSSAPGSVCIDGCPAPGTTSTLPIYSQRRRAALPLPLSVMPLPGTDPVDSAFRNIRSRNDSQSRVGYLAGTTCGTCLMGGSPSGGQFKSSASSWWGVIPPSPFRSLTLAIGSQGSKSGQAFPWTSRVHLLPLLACPCLCFAAVTPWTCAQLLCVCCCTCEDWKERVQGRVGCTCPVDLGAHPMDGADDPHRTRAIQGASKTG